MKINLNTLLLILGGLGVFAPDVVAVSAWLASMHVAWLALPVKILAFVATAFAAAPLIVPRLRAFLSLLGLATPPGAVVPDTKPSDQQDTQKIVGLFVVIAALTAVSCQTPPTKPDTFFGAVVTCTQANTNNAQAGAAVLHCLTGAAGGNYVACLQGLVVAGYWTVDEVACIVRHYATTSAQRANAGTADSMDPIILRNANAWLRSEKIIFKAAP